MHNICGGTYAGENYSCIFWSPEKYLYLNTPEQYYCQLGVHETDDDSASWPRAMLVFDSRTDKLVFAKECPTLKNIALSDTEAIKECFRREENAIVMALKEESECYTS